MQGDGSDLTGSMVAAALVAGAHALLALLRLVELRFTPRERAVTPQLIGITIHLRPLLAPDPETRENDQLWPDPSRPRVNIPDVVAPVVTSVPGKEKCD